MTNTSNHPNDLDAAAQALAGLDAIRDGAVTGMILASQAAGGPIELSQLQPTQKAIAPLSDLTRKATLSYTRREVIDYQPSGSTADGQIMWLDIAAVPMLKTVLDGSADLADLPTFDPARQALTKMLLVALRVENTLASAVFVQSLDARRVVARSTKLGILVRRGVLDVPNGELLILGSDVTAVMTGDYVFFRNRSAFQQLTGILEELRQQAATTFQAVTLNLRIDGYDMMATVVIGEPAMLGKMASIQRKLDRYPQYREALTMPKLVPFVRDHPEYGLEVIGEGEQARFVFHNDPQNRFKILKLLDDDYLKSELTQLEYEANSKSAPLTG